ncbi:hypothetical protein TBK1r_25410 [Stieleria magnilauensis]|uniref:Uncharacterized protein n=1 Tax=Stieleria magnilauensis TaxID=2527963 RepID=A0ABX5XNV4_9BACT|nr:hypothetical protein TBK1r_25410 [Planctomycetes bacterium TBK1r]
MTPTGSKPVAGGERSSSRRWRCPDLRLLAEIPPGYSVRCRSPLTPNGVMHVSGRAQALRSLIVPQTPEGSRPTAKKCFTALPGRTGSDGLAPAPSHPVPTHLVRCLHHSLVSTGSLAPLRGTRRGDTGKVERPIKINDRFGLLCESVWITPNSIVANHRPVFRRHPAPARQDARRDSRVDCRRDEKTRPDRAFLSRVCENARSLIDGIQPIGPINRNAKGLA